MQQAILKIFFLIVLLFPKLEMLSVFSQNRIDIDSLEQLLEESLDQEKPDSIINSLLLNSFNYYENNEWGKAASIAKKGISLFKNNSFDYCRLWYEKLGFLYLRHDIYQLALNTYYEAFNLAKEKGKPLGSCYNNLARVYLAQNLNLSKAENLFIQAIEENKKIKEPTEKLKQLAYSYNQLGIVYEKKEEYKNAYSFYKKALDIRYEIDDSQGLLNSLYTMAYYYGAIEEYDSAIVYYNKSLDVDKKKGYQVSILVNRALVYAYKHEYNKAHTNLNLAMDAAKRSSFDRSRVYKFQSKVYKVEGNLPLAISSATKALEIANKYNHSILKLEILPALITYLTQTKDYKKANWYQNKYAELLQTKNKERNKIVQESYEIIEDIRINALTEEKNALKSDNRILFIVIFTIVIILLLFIFLIVLLRRSRKKHIKIYKDIRVHAVIAKILGNITGEQRSLNVFLQDAIEEILKISWLKFETKGSIFVTNKDGNLEMIAQKNLGESLLKMCAIVKPGQCLCGKALEQKSMVYCDHISDKHDFHPEGMTPHGHYNMPIMFHGKVLGVLNVYLAHGHQKKDYEEEFLETICKTLASVINRKSVQIEFEKQSKKQESLNQKLFAQTLEVEQRNVEIKQFLNEQEKLNQKLFAQKMEVEQRNSEVERISKAQEETNQKLFAQKMEVEQRNIEIQKYSEEQDKLNQKFFAQTLELDQRNIEIKRYSDEVEKQKKNVESAHKDVTDSINYAQTIQSALLPADETVKSLLNDYFILFKPKDVVSGDFYYVTEVESHVIFAAADCTGHGVPGGFLTMLGISFLDDIVKRQEVNTPAKALEQLRINVKNVFERKGEINQNGLDIALCSIEKGTNTLNFSGAYSSLYIIRKGEIIEYKATKNPIGWHPKEIPFKNYTIKLQNNDLIYLFSDGYHDQFGLNNRKFLKKRFKLLLQEIKDMPMDEQKNILGGIFEKWKKDKEQTDDVTVMAIRWHM